MSQRSQQPILKGQVICLSGLGWQEKESLESTVKAMGGTMAGSLNDAVTVVIARDLSTPKCQTAIQRNLWGKQQTEVVGPNWLESCLTTRTFQDPTRFRLKLFAGEVMCTVGFDDQAVPKIRRWLEFLGGTFSQDIDRDCTVLLANQSSGKQISFAKKHKIPIVPKAWFDSCLSTCKLQPKASFSVLPKPERAAFSQSESASRSNTPLLSSQERFSDSSDGFGSHGLPIFGSALPPSEDSCSQGFHFGERVCDESFLEGFKIFIARDVPDTDCKELRVLCRKAGATNVSRDARNLPTHRGATHIITAATRREKEHDDILEVCDRTPPLLHQAWLRESCKVQRCLPVKQFQLPEEPLPLADAANPQEEAAAAQGHSSLQKKLSSSVPAVKTLGSKPTSPPSKAANTIDRQTSKATAQSLKSSGRQASQGTKGEQPNGPEKISDASSDLTNDPISEEPVSADTTQKANIFVGHTFEVQIADESVKQELQTMIRQHGGKVQEAQKATLGRKYSGANRSLQYKVVAMDAPAEAPPKQVASLGRKPPSKSEVKRVSEYWVRKCVAAGAIFAVAGHDVYRPLMHALPIEGLAALCVCKTKVGGEHRRIVDWLLEAVGVSVKENLNKKVSHLLVGEAASAASAKQLFAEQHGIPQVSLAWLEACVAAGRPVEVLPDLAPHSDPFHSAPFPRPSPAGFEVDPAFAAMARDGPSRKRPLELTKAAHKSPLRPAEFGSTRKPLDFTRVGDAAPSKPGPPTPMHQPDFTACFVGTRRSPSKPAESPAAKASTRTPPKPTSPPPSCSPHTRSHGAVGAQASPKQGAASPLKRSSQSPPAAAAAPGREGSGPAPWLGAEDCIAETDEDCPCEELSAAVLPPAPATHLLPPPPSAPPSARAGHGSAVPGGDAAAGGRADADGEEKAGGSQESTDAGRGVLGASQGRALSADDSLQALAQRLALRSGPSSSALPPAPSASKRKRHGSPLRLPKSPPSAATCSAAPLSPASAKSPRSPLGARTRGSAGKGTPPTQVVGRRRRGVGRGSQKAEEDGDEEEEEDGREVEEDLSGAAQQRRLQLESARQFSLQGRSANDLEPRTSRTSLTSRAPQQPSPRSLQRPEATQRRGNSAASGGQRGRRVSEGGGKAVERGLETRSSQEAEEEAPLPRATRSASQGSQGSQHASQDSKRATRSASVDAAAAAARPRKARRRYGTL